MLIYSIEARCRYKLATRTGAFMNATTVLELNYRN